MRASTVQPTATLMPDPRPEGQAFQASKAFPRRVTGPSWHTTRTDRKRLSVMEVWVRPAPRSMPPVEYPVFSLMVLRSRVTSRTRSRLMLPVVSMCESTSRTATKAVCGSPVDAMELATTRDAPPIWTRERSRVPVAVSTVPPVDPANRALPLAPLNRTGLPSVPWACSVPATWNAGPVPDARWSSTTTPGSMASVTPAGITRGCVTATGLSAAVQVVSAARVPPGTVIPEATACWTDPRSAAAAGLTVTALSTAAANRTMARLMWST